MKIGIVCFPTVGGSGVVAAELGKSLAESGDEVHFISYERPFRLHLNHPNVFFHRVELKSYESVRHQEYALLLAAKIAMISDKFQLDLLHVHYAVPHLISAALAKELLNNSGPAIVATFHGTDVFLMAKDPYYHPLINFALNKCNAITAVSNNLRDQAAELFGLSRPIECVYNFDILHQSVDTANKIKKEFASEGEKLLLHVSNFRQVKRPQDSLYVFNEVHKALPCKMLFLGTGPQLEEVKKLVDQLGLEKLVDFIGVTVDVHTYMACADLLLMTSEHESFGLVAIEAMSMGVPVIATNTGGIPEVVQDGTVGFLSDVGDCKSMAENAIRVLSDSLLHSQMSRAAVKHVQEKFSRKEKVEQYKSIYRKALSHAGIKPR